MKENTLKNKNTDPDVISFDDDDLLISDDEENLSTGLENQYAEEEKAKMNNVVKTKDYNEYSDFDYFNDFIQFEIKDLKDEEVIQEHPVIESENFNAIEIDLNKIETRSEHILQSDFVKEEGIVSVDGESIDEYFGENEDILLSEHTKQMEQLHEKSGVTGVFNKFMSNVAETAKREQEEHLNNLQPTDIQDSLNLNLNKEQLNEIEKAVEESKKEIVLEKPKKFFGLKLNKEDYVPDLNLDLNKQEPEINTEHIENEVLNMTIEKNVQEQQSFLDMILHPIEEVDRTKARISISELDNILGENQFEPVGYDPSADLDRELAVLDTKMQKRKNALFGKKLKKEKINKPKKEKLPKKPKIKKEKIKKEKLPKRVKTKKQQDILPVIPEVSNISDFEINSMLETPTNIDLPPIDIPEIKIPVIEEPIAETIVETASVFAGGLAIEQLINESIPEKKVSEESIANKTIKKPKLIKEQRLKISKQPKRLNRLEKINEEITNVNILNNDDELFKKTKKKKVKKQKPIKEPKQKTVKEKPIKEPKEKIKKEKIKKEPKEKKPIDKMDILIVLIGVNTIISLLGLFL